MSKTQESEVNQQKGVQNPFPGLRPFAIEESHLFFGREGQTDEVLDKLSKHKFVSIIGPSGSGKSSFVYCGVLPILYGGFLTDRGPNWDVIVTRPGNAPVENLAQAILGKDLHYLVADPEEKQIKEKITSTLINSSSLGLVEAVNQVRRDTKKNYLVLVDQFEELFRFKQEGDRQEALNKTFAFVNLLMEAVDHEDSSIHVAITMRSDFIGECAAFPTLTRKINDSHYLIPQLTRDQKRKAIEGPVAVAGAVIEPRLVQQLLNDLGDNPDQLPILQHSLMRTYDYWSNNTDKSEPIDLKHYEAIGTMREALSLHANEAYEELNDKQKEICEVLFKAITEKRGEVFGIRRPTPLIEIAQIAEVDWQEVAAVVEKFREPGRSLLVPPYGVALRRDHVIDISHESLMRIWVRLKNWVDEEADAVQMYVRLADAAEMYQVGKSALWRPPDLQLALNWKAKHKPTLVWGQRYHPAFERTMVFLQYSEKEWEEEQRIKELRAKRALRNARITTLVVSAALVVSMGFLLFAFVQQGIAERAAEEAKVNLQQSLIERNNGHITASLAQLNEEEATEQGIIARENAIEAGINADSAEAAAIRAVQNMQLAMQNADSAQRATKLANENEIKARENANLATKEAERANTNAGIAETRQYLALASKIALKAKERQGADLQINGLLAQQAYNFNQAYGGEKFNADIYSGLYYGIKYQGDRTGNYPPLIKPLAGHSRQVSAIASSRSGKSVFSGDSEGKIMQWTQSEDQWLSKTLYNDSDAQIQALAQTGDGLWLAAAIHKVETQASLVLLFDLTKSSPAPRQVSGFDGDTKFHLVFGPGDQSLFVLENDGKAVKKVSIPQGTVSSAFSSTDRINNIDISPDGNTLIAAMNSGAINTYDITNDYASAEFAPPNGSNDAIWSIKYSPDGRYVASGDEEGWTRVYDAGNGRALHVFPAQTSRISEIDFSPNGDYMASASFNGSVKMWSVMKFNESPKNLEPDPSLGQVFSLAFTPDSKQVFTGYSQQERRVEITVWPTSIELMSGVICDLLERNMSQNEWNSLVSDDIPYEKTCPALPVGEDVLSTN